MKGRVLVVAGSDSGGGAGIEADIKTITALNGYAATAITALTAQNTLEIRAIHPVPAAFVRQAIAAVLDDIGADCVKTGMLHDGATIDAVADALETRPALKLVVDPVMVSSSGTRLLDAQAVEALKRRLIARATIVTPNLPEAEALTGESVQSPEAMRRAGEKLLGLGVGAALITGGHLAGDVVRDVAVLPGSFFTLESPRIMTRATHGTGCTLASAIACGLAQGMELRAAIERAHRFVRRAIETAPGLGRGHGPLNHAHPLDG
jgi:hydroxymethylpyrimidine/phosphomethylpyrimidine kinase